MDCKPNRIEQQPLLTSRNRCTKASKLLNEGVALAEDRKFKQAIDKFLSAHQLLPGFSPLFNSALCCEAIGAYQTAITYLTQALTYHDPRACHAYAQRAFCLMKLERYSEALLDAVRAERVLSKAYYIHLIKAEAFEKLGNQQEALVSFTNALKLAPDHHRARARRAAIYFDLGFAEFAIEDLTILIENQVDEITARKLRSRCHALLGNFAEALLDHVEVCRAQSA